MVPTARIAASDRSAGRQPWTWSSHPANGRKTVLGKRAIRVTAVRARARLRSNQTATTANAGSYSTLAMTRPMAAQIR